MSVVRSVDIAVIGSGLSATATVINLLDRTPQGVRVAIVGPQASLGRGVAYGTDHLCHLLNVPAERMGVYEDRPSHFLDWLRERGVACGTGEFVPRRIYGDYLRHTLATAARRADNRGDLTVISATADGVLPSDSGPGFAFKLSDGDALRADAAVLALGSSCSRLPLSDDRIDPGARPLIVEDVWTEWADTLDRDAPVAIVGSGLSMVDQVLLMANRGHRGPINVISRRGLLPHRHVVPRAAPAEAALAGTALARMLAEVRAMARRQDDWRAAIDGLRPVTQALWAGLSPEDRSRFLRHLLPFWTVHRHRMAPEAARSFDLLVARGQVRVAAGRILAIEAEEAGAVLRWRRRGATSEQWIPAARILNCTGTERCPDLTSHPLLAALSERGAVVADPLGLGIVVDDDSRAIGADGAAVRSLYAVGPATAGRFWEITAVPEIRRQAADVAARLAAPWH